jgi:hypothetical protein
MGFTIAEAQNVGIGTTTPADLLHINSSTTNVQLRLSSSANAELRSGVQLITNNGASDLTRYGSSASAFTAGINMNSATRLYSSNGAMLIGNGTAEPIHFITSNTERLVIDAMGNLGLNISVPMAKLHIVNTTVGTNSLLINHASSISRMKPNGEFYHEGNFWVHSGFGAFRLGYPENGWEWSTIGGGQDLQLWSYNTADPAGIFTKRMLVDGVNGNFFINSQPAAELLNHAQLRVERGVGTTTTVVERGAVLGINHRAAGSGLYGMTPAARSGSNYYAGVTGTNTGVVGDRFGVIGLTNGSVVDGVVSAGVGGYGVYGVLGSSGSTNGAGLLAQHTGGRTALELNNGFIKVSGTNKTAFKRTTTAANVNSNITALSYDNPSPNDIIIATHNYSPANTYFNKAFGVFFLSNTWYIYTEDLSAMPLDVVFNVLVIKQ